MEVDYQIFINIFSNTFMIAFPIALIMLVVIKLTDIFLDFVLGKKIKF